MPPTVEDLVHQLKAAGVTIKGEAALRAAVALDSAQPSELLQILKTGRKQGIEFMRSPAVADDDLLPILRGFFPDRADAQCFLENMRHTSGL